MTGTDYADSEGFELLQSVTPSTSRTTDVSCHGPLQRGCQKSLHYYRQAAQLLYSMQFAPASLSWSWGSWFLRALTLTGALNEAEPAQDGDLCHLCTASSSSSLRIDNRPCPCDACPCLYAALPRRRPLWHCHSLCHRL